MTNLERKGPLVSRRTLLATGAFLLFDPLGTIRIHFFDSAHHEGETDDDLIHVYRDGFSASVLLDHNENSVHVDAISGAGHRFLVQGRMDNRYESMFVNRYIHFAYPSNNQALRWTTEEMKVAAMGLMLSLKVNTDIYRFQPKGFGTYSRGSLGESPLYLVKAQPDSTDKSFAFVPYPHADIAELYPQAVNLSDQAAVDGFTARALNIHLDRLTDVHLIDGKNGKAGNTSLQQALVSGLGEMAAYQATGTWGSDKSMEILSSYAIQSDSFLGKHHADLIVLAGQTMQKAHDQFPGIWGHMNYNLMLETRRKLGGGLEWKSTMNDIRASGQFPAVVTKDEYMAWGDEYAKSINQQFDFTEWFNGKNVFSMEP